MTTRKPPPPSFRPTAGFSSVTEAVRHFAAEGKTPDEIATLTGSAVATVRRLLRKARMQRIGRAARGLSLPQRIKVKQAYVAYLDFMVIALKSDRDALHQICRFTHVNKEPALPPEQKVDEAEPARAGLVDTPQQQETADYEHPKLGHDHRPDSAVRHHGDRPERGVLPLGDALRGDDNPVISEPKPMMVMKLDKRPMDLTNASRFYTLRREGMYLNLDGSGFTDVRRHAYRATLPQARKMRLVNAVAMGCSLSPFELSKK